MVNKIRKLTKDEIDVRVGTVSKEGKGFSLLLYKDARVDMAILDETFGAMNWQRFHKELKGNIYCGVAVWDEAKQVWVEKWDCGTESNTEKEKGESSDSFKRACVLWKIGRELYTSPFVWVSSDSGFTKFDRFYVDEITYIGDRIETLVIKEEKTHKVVFSNKNGVKKESNNTPKKESNNTKKKEPDNTQKTDFTLQEYVDAIKRMKVNIDKDDPEWWEGIKTMFDVKKWSDINDENVKEIGRLCKEKVFKINEQKGAKSE